MKITLTGRNDDYTITLTTTAECLPDILDHVKYFLRGCGFSVDRELVIAEDEGDE